MNNIYQTTLVNPVKFVGTGLHSGANSEINIIPANENHGIVFKRIDIEKNNLIKANFKNVTSTKLCTTLENEFGVKVSTVEHLLAALYFAEIDNVLIEINNYEVPIMDGSAKSFLDVLKNVKIKTFTEKRIFLKVLEKIELVKGGRSISLEPGDDTLEVEFQLNYENKIIGKQKNTINFIKDDLEDIISSRTFCLFNDIEKIKKLGLAKGGSLENAVVVDENKILNENGLRNNKEFVNHKILDLAGDFLLSGARILGKVKCVHGGHELTNLFLHKLFNEKNLLKIFEKEEISLISKKIKSPKSIKLAVNA